jgi:hypothetical protein
MPSFGVPPATPFGNPLFQFSTHTTPNTPPEQPPRCPHIGNIDTIGPWTGGKPETIWQSPSSA